jgi:hypothetical protein
MATESQAAGQLHFNFNIKLVFFCSCLGWGKILLATLAIIWSIVAAPDDGC